MSEAAINNLLQRLEAVTARLEAVEKGAGGAGGAAGGAASAPAAGAAESGSATVAEYDALVAGLSGFFASARKIGNAELKAQVDAFEKALSAQRAFLNIAAQCAKPSQEVLQKLLKPTQDAINEVISTRDKNRGNALWDHLSTLSEGVPALGWVIVSPTPGPYVKEYKGNSEFYSNKLRRNYKGKDEDQMAFADGFSQFLAGLMDFIKAHHTTELSWNKSGGDASKFVGAAPAAAAPAAAPVAPPAGGPPPPAPGNAPVAKKGPDVGALFAQINQGSGVTSGLKKVDKSQMTHKNPALRATSVVKATEKKAAARPALGRPVKKGTPKFALEGNKWVVEFQENNKEIVIDGTETKQTIYIYKCDNSVIQVKGDKINSIAVDSCNKCGIVFNNAIAQVEMVNCNRVDVQCLGFVPAFAVDKSSSIGLIWSKDCAERSELVSSKSDQINIQIPGGDDLVELNVPEQFKTVVKDGKLVTECVEHLG